MKGLSGLAIKRIYYFNALCVALFYILGHVAIATSDTIRTSQFKHNISSVTIILLCVSISGIIFFILASFITTFYLLLTNAKKPLSQVV